MPDFSFETEVADQGYTAVAGVDEGAEIPWSPMALAPSPKNMS